MTSKAPKGHSQRHLKFDEELQTVLVVSTDKKYGWIIVIASFFCNFIVDGTILSFGVILEEVSEHFNVKASKVALANSLLTGFYFLLGPIACALINRFGCRITGILGGLIASGSLFGCAFINDLIVFHVVYGFFVGFGMCIIFSASLVIVNFYFEKWRSLAVAIAVCGTGSGIMCYPILLKYIEDFNWDEKFMLLSLCCSITILLALFFKPLQSETLISNKPPVSSTSKDTDSRSNKRRESFFEKYNNATYPRTAAIAPDNSAVGHAPVPHVSFFRSQSCWKRCWFKFRMACKCCKCGIPSSDVSRPMYRDDILFSSSLKKLKEYKETAHIKDPEERRRSSFEYHKAVTRTTTPKDLEEPPCACCTIALKRTLATMFDLSLLKSLSCILLVFSGFFSFCGYYVPLIYVIARAKSKNMDPNLVNYLLSSIGLSNLVGRLLCGVISSFEKVSCLIASYVTIFFAGVSCIASNYLNEIYGQFAFCITYGLLISGLVALRTPLLVEIYGLENLTNTFGLSLIFMGFGCFIGTAAVAEVYAYINNYDIVFLFSGAILIFSAVLLMPIKRILKWEESKES